MFLPRQYEFYPADNANHGTFLYFLHIIQTFTKASSNDIDYYYPRHIYIYALYIIYMKFLPY